MTNPLRIVRTLYSKFGVLSLLLGAALTGLPAQAEDVFEAQLLANAPAGTISASLQAFHSASHIAICNVVIVDAGDDVAR